MSGAIASADAARLAARVSMAPRVTPALLRHQRLALGVEVGAEADVWFAPGVAVTSPDGFEWQPEVAEALRRELLRDGLDVYDAVWRVTQRALVDADVTARIEAELMMLEALVDPTQAARVPDARRDAAAARIEELLRVAVRALVRGGRSGMAYWAGRLLPRLPAHVRAREEASMLDAGASLQLHGALPESMRGGDDALPDWLAEAAPESLPRVTIAVERRGEVLVLGHVDALRDGVELSLPDTTPLVLEVRGAYDEGFTRVSWERAPAASDEPKVVAVGDGAVLLRTLLGEEYDLSRVDDVETAARAAVLDQSEYAALHRPFLGPAAIDVDRDLSPGVWFELVGAPGVGKTAQIVRVIDELSARKSSSRWTVAWHLVRADVPEWRDVERVCASLAAQIVAQRPELDDGRTRRGSDALGAVLRHFAHERADDERLFLVVDDAAVLAGHFAEALATSSVAGITLVSSRRTRDDESTERATTWKHVKREVRSAPDVWLEGWFGDEQFAHAEKEIRSCSTWAEARLLRDLLRALGPAVGDAELRAVVWGEGRMWGGDAPRSEA